MSEKKTLPQILVCDDDAIFQVGVKRSLAHLYQCHSAYNGDEALAILRQQQIDIVLLDIQMRTQDEGLKYLPRLAEADPEVSIAISSQYTDFA